MPGVAVYCTVAVIDAGHTKVCDSVAPDGVSVPATVAAENGAAVYAAVICGAEFAGGLVHSAVGSLAPPPPPPPPPPLPPLPPVVPVPPHAASVEMASAAINRSMPMVPLGATSGAPRAIAGRAASFDRMVMRCGRRR